MKKFLIDLLRDTLDFLFSFDEWVRLRQQGKLSASQEKALEDAAKTILELFTSLRDEFCERMAKGGTKPVVIVLKAIGPEALSLHWFIEGLKNLLEQGKTVQLTIPKHTSKDIKKEIRFFSKMGSLEKKIKKGETLTSAIAMTGAPCNEEKIRKHVNKIKTEYYRDLPLKIQIYLFRKLYLSIWQYLLG